MVNEIQQATEVTDLLNDLVGQVQDAAVARMRRDPNIPAGAVLSESELDGIVHRELKQNSMVRMGKTPLPERFEVWDVYGRPSLVPTAQMTRMLQKVNAERPNARAFHTHRGGVTRETCGVCPQTSESFAGTCAWCFERTGGNVQKRFDSQDAQEAHYRAFHYEQWQSLERRIEREQRQAELATQRELAQAMMALAQGRVPAVEVELPVEADVNSAYACPECDFSSLSAAGLSAHRRARHGE